MHHMNGGAVLFVIIGIVLIVALLNGARES
jgi:hypothetical protein